MQTRSFVPFGLAISLVFFSFIFSHHNSAAATQPTAVQTDTFSAEAKALLEKAARATPSRYKYAIDKGAQVLPTPDGRSFYLLWYPSATATRKVTMLALHGSEGWVFDEFFLWHDSLERNGVGILALQWWFGGGGSINDYYAPEVMYPMAAELLKKQGNTSRSVLMQGFSRGSANSYAMAFYDRKNGNNLFAMTASLSGGLQTSYPLYGEIAAGKYGPDAFAGTHFTLFCGERDPNPDRDGCPAMRRTGDFLASFGGTVDLFLDEPTLGHGGINTKPDLEDQLFTQFKKLANANVKPVPAVRVLAPNGGETLRRRGSFLISWQTENLEFVVSHDVLLSLDGGSTFPTTLAAGLSGTAQTFTYQIPADSPIRKTVRIRVNATNSDGAQGSDDSDGNCAIKK